MRLRFLPFLIPAFLYAEQLDLPEGFEPDVNRPDVPLSFSATRKYYKEKEQIQAKYRERFADAIKHADGAEILLLSFTLEREIPEGTEEEYLLILPYGSYSKVLQRKSLTGQSLAQCRNLAGKILREPYVPGPFCHFPIHGVRLYRDRELIFETSLSWHCGNYFLKYPDDYDKASWVGFGSGELEIFLKKELPVPQSEIDRFNAKYGSQTDKARHGGFRTRN